MKKLKIKFILAIVLIAFGNSFASLIPPDIQTQLDETVFTVLIEYYYTFTRF